ncbi:MAG: GIY-YIG nuclease family protein [Alphaproteobacteria bacterium]|nr:GIY-YIG nuclease family protein [Alphaproteobacteria bacterium]
MTEPIKLIDVLPGFHADVFKKNHPGCRRQVRFNIKDDIVPRDFAEMHHDQDDDFEPWILTVGKPNNTRMQLNDVIFQFIRIDAYQNRWLFVGAYKILDLNKGRIKNYIYANAKRLSEFDVFNGRLVIEKPANRSFRYIDDNILDNITVSCVLPQSYRENADKFPGCDNLCYDYKSLSRCIHSTEWKSALSNVYGVYVLTDRKTGKQYIGSATGMDGIYGRWCTYLDQGYDDSNKDYPNKKLKDLVKKEGIEYIKNNFQYSILEIFKKNQLGCDLALEREKFWKDVFQTRQFGYNDN